MPDKENKTLTPEEIKEQRKVAESKPIEQVQLNPNLAPDAVTKAAIVRQNLSETDKENLAVRNAISDAYSSPIGELGNKITEWETNKKNLQEQDEVAQRRGRSMQMVAGISDGLASLANLIGVGSYGSSYIDMGGGALTPLQEKLEAARLERKADIKSIDDRLDQMRNQELQLKLQRGAAMADAIAKENAAKEQRRQFNEEIALRKSNAKDAREQAQKSFNETVRHHKEQESISRQNAKNDYNYRMKQLQQAAEQNGLTGSYPVLVGENEMLSIPKQNINHDTVGRIFNQLPEEYQRLAPGKPVYRYEFGQKIDTGEREMPSLEEMLAAIGAASRTDANAQNELRKLAGTYKPAEIGGANSGSFNLEDYADDTSVVNEYDNLPPDAVKYLQKKAEREAHKTDPKRTERKRMQLNAIINQK